MENMVSWFKNKEAGNYPVIGIENEQGELMGFASYGSFRAYPANKYTLEHSVYVAKAHRGKGIANILMSHLIELAKDENARPELAARLGLDSTATLESVTAKLQEDFKEIIDKEKTIKRLNRVHLNFMIN